MNCCKINKLIKVRFDIRCQILPSFGFFIIRYLRYCFSRASFCNMREKNAYICYSFSYYFFIYIFGYSYILNLGLGLLYSITLRAPLNLNATRQGSNLFQISILQAPSVSPTNPKMPITKTVQISPTTIFSTIL